MLPYSVPEVIPQTPDLFFQKTLIFLPPSHRALNATLRFQWSVGVWRWKIWNNLGESDGAHAPVWNCWTNCFPVFSWLEMLMNAPSISYVCVFVRLSSMKGRCKLFTMFICSCGLWEASCVPSCERWNHPTNNTRSFWSQGLLGRGRFFDVHLIDFFLKSMFVCSVYIYIFLPMCVWIRLSSFHFG